jgi:hypothetical protein
LAPKTIYTRENPNPNHVEPVSSPEKLLCRTREKALDPFYYMYISISLPKDGAQSIDNLEFDTLFQKTLFKSKSKTSLDDIVLDQKRFQAMIPKNISQIPNPARAMVPRFTPLILLAQMHDLPQK